MPNRTSKRQAATVALGQAPAADGEGGEDTDLQGPGLLRPRHIPTLPTEPITKGIANGRCGASAVISSRAG
jgi:hypothetical protein